MSTTPDRRAELIAAAAAGELTAAETAELGAARELDPSLDAEIDELRRLIGSVAETVTSWDDSAPAADLRDRVLGIPARGHLAAVPDAREAAVQDARVAAVPDARKAVQDARVAAVPDAREAEVPDARVAAVPDAREAVQDARPERADPTGVPVEADVPAASRRRLRRALPVLAAAASLLIGLGIGALALPRPASEAPIGAPGELGAREPIAFDAEPAGVQVDGTIVAHTWGTETILEIEGLPAGESYSVVVLDDAGGEESSGTFLGSTVAIDCSMNAAVLRPDATAVEIRDATGHAVATASLPAVV